MDLLRNSKLARGIKQPHADELLFELQRRALRVTFDNKHKKRKKTRLQIDLSSKALIFSRCKMTRTALLWSSKSNSAALGYLTPLVNLESWIFLRFSCPFSKVLLQIFVKFKAMTSLRYLECFQLYKSSQKKYQHCQI